uniref:Iron transport protein FeoA-1 n=1 Tax=bacterium ML-1 TaxID=1297055 RepID=M1QLJ9_UNCXX|nr:iron transport protein FeoA-1 [bacterium ML-1]
MMRYFRNWNGNARQEPASCFCPSADSNDGEQTLTKVGYGCRCRIRRHRAHGAIRQRLLDLGFVPNAEIEMVRCATLGDPLEMRVGDYYVTLRKREADLIDVLTA